MAILSFYFYLKTMQFIKYFIVYLNMDISIMCYLSYKAKVVGHRHLHKYRKNILLFASFLYFLISKNFNHESEVLRYIYFMK